jgi:hypothetical protein
MYAYFALKNSVKQAKKQIWSYKQTIGRVYQPLPRFVQIYNHRQGLSTTAEVICKPRQWSIDPADGSMNGLSTRIKKSNYLATKN